MEFIIFVLGTFIGYIFKRYNNYRELNEQYKLGIKSAHMTALSAKYKIETVELHDNQYLTTIINKR